MIDFNYVIDQQKKELENLINKLERHRGATSKFLASCETHGIKLVSIGTKTDKIESTKKWERCGGSAFSDKRKDGWPAIWRAAEDAGVYAGAGNSGQAQISYQAELIKGVYEFDGEVWTRIE
jgi:hypothetical protein